MGSKRKFALVQVLAMILTLFLSMRKRENNDKCIRTQSPVKFYLKNVYNVLVMCRTQNGHLTGINKRPEMLVNARQVPVFK